MRNFLFTILLCFACSGAVSALAQPLPANEAFALTAQAKSTEQIMLQWQIAPGYHLYRDRIAIALLPHGSALLKPITLPTGLVKTDVQLGHYQVFENQLRIPITVHQAVGSELVLSVQYQGCADSGFCYPPTTEQLRLRMLPGNQATKLNKPTVSETIRSSQAKQSPNLLLQHLLQQRARLPLLLSFFGFGLLLAFTPCVFPMLPILSSIIAGQGTHTNPRKAFYLSLTYVLGMACAYTGAGLLAGLAGNYWQARLQNPWVLSCFSLVFVGLALSLFGLYDLRLPAAWQHRLHNLHHRQRGGTYLGVAVMGALSMLIVSPCVSAPLVAALAYLSHTSDIWLSSFALFTMALGMGTPLLIIGTLGGRLLPQAGIWMQGIKTFFGILLLAVAVELIGRVLPDPIVLMLWAVLAMMSSILLGTFSTVHSLWQKILKGFGVLFFSYSIVLLVGASQGSSDPLRPLSMAARFGSETTPIAWQRVTYLDALQQALQETQHKHKPVLLDFYADWCKSCKLLDRKIFSKPRIGAALRNYILLRVDVTANDASTRAIQQIYTVLAPPTLIYLNPAGNEIKRLIGEFTIKQFLDFLGTN